MAPVVGVSGVRHSRVTVHKMVFNPRFSDLLAHGEVALFIIKMIHLDAFSVHLRTVSTMHNAYRWGHIDRCAHGGRWAAP